MEIKEGEPIKPAKFRQKPTVVEAIQFTGENFGEVAQLSENIYGPYGKEYPYIVFNGDRGRENIHVGNWVIKDANGVYHCSDEFFLLNYEPIFEAELDPTHTLEEDFAAFLTYSNLTHETPSHRSLMIRAFEAGRNGTLR